MTTQARIANWYQTGLEPCHGSCPSGDQLLAAALGEQGPGLEQARLALGNCPSCAQRARQALAIHRELQAIEPAQLRTPRRAAGWPLALVASLIGAVAIWSTQTGVESGPVADDLLVAHGLEAAELVHQAAEPQLFRSSFDGRDDDRIFRDNLM